MFLFPSLSLSLLKPTFFQSYNVMVEITDAAVDFLSVFLRLQPQGFSIFVQQLQLPLQLLFHILHVPGPIQAGSGRQTFGVAGHPAHVRLIVSKRANI